MIGELDPKITALELSPKYGKFSIEPLERGFGHTMGNAFRRVLLSHIPGAAVTDVRINGALHEFSTIPGVVEDVMELVLNLKELAIKVHPGEDPEAATEERILKIDASGETKVIGADVICPPDVEIMNPEAHIAELSAPDARLEVELWIEVGKGYRPTEERDSARRGSGIIPVDALFSPIKRAAYAVEPTRLGHRTDLDRLVLELWGNGTIVPEDALKMGARVLQSYIGIFLGGVEAEEAALAVSDEGARESSRWLETLIEDVDFSVRTFNCLKKESINTLGELIRHSEAELLAIRNFGKRSLDEVIEKLAQFDLALREPDGDDLG
jgi:DNA-directed RNA polymerase subunit alpha